MNSRQRILDRIAAVKHPGPTVTYDLEATFSNGGTFYRHGHRGSFVAIEREIGDNLRAGAVRVHVEVGS
jgi:hypothetical protein